MVIKQYLGDFLSKAFNIKKDDSYFCINNSGLPKGRMQGRIEMFEVDVDKGDKFGLDAKFTFNVWFRSTEKDYTGLYICSFPLAFFQEAYESQPIALLKQVFDVDALSVEVNITQEVMKGTGLEEISPSSNLVDHNEFKMGCWMLGKNDKGYVSVIKAS